MRKCWIGDRVLIGSDECAGVVPHRWRVLTSKQVATSAKKNAWARAIGQWAARVAPRIKKRRLGPSGQFPVPIVPGSHGSFRISLCKLRPDTLPLTSLLTKSGTGEFFS